MVNSCMRVDPFNGTGEPATSPGIAERPIFAVLRVRCRTGVIIGAFCVSTAKLEVSLDTCNCRTRGPTHSQTMCFALPKAHR